VLDLVNMEAAELLQYHASLRNQKEEIICVLVHYHGVTSKSCYTTKLTLLANCLTIWGKFMIDNALPIEESN